MSAWWSHVGIPLLLAGLGSLVVALLLGPLLLPLLRTWRWGQSIRDEGPTTHRAKQGTPTMGGLIFLISTTVALLLVSPVNLYLLTVLLLFWGYALLGFLDDFLKVVLKRPLGLKARYKLLWQLVLGLILVYVALNLLDFSTAVAIPFTRWEWDLGPLYLPFILFLTLGFSNSVNLTDGLDGLVAGTTIISMVAYTFISLGAGRPELAAFAAALAGGSLGFLRYNRHPAQVFMGDTGSLAIGGALAALAVLTKTELLLVLIGGLYVLEAFSVILQVLSFRLTGRRVLRMSPLHHHFELLGWSETQVVGRFWLAAFLFGLLGLWGFAWGGS